MPWRSFSPDPAYRGQWLVAGDLDGDGRSEVILHSAKTVRIYKSDRAAKTSGKPVGTGVNFTLY